jgi:F0F1-type ATP synthase assembly protein I
LGYLHLFLVSYWVHDMKSVRSKAITVGVIFAVDIVAALISGVMLGWI